MKLFRFSACRPSPMTALGASLLGSCLLFVSAAAHAQESAGEAPGSGSDPAPAADGAAPESNQMNLTGSSSSSAEEPRPKMSLAVAPPGPALQRRAYMHEGFYLRVSVGPGWSYSAINSGSTATPDVEGHAFALGADLLVGGSPSPGMALGAGALTNLGFGADLQQDGRSLGNGTIFNFIAGPFLDAFPNDKEGFHLGTLLGFAGMVQSSGIAALPDTAFGGGGGMMFGYGAWVAPEWSAGFDVRATGAYMVSGDYGAGVFSVVALVTILNH